MPSLSKAALLATAGCAGSVEVTRTFTPTAASRMSSDKLAAVAVVRDGERIPVPAGARVEADRIVLPRERVHVHKLASGDVIEQDAAGRIVAVRSAGDPPVVTRFVAGTAESPSGSDEVRGEVEGVAVLALRRSDGIEMHGRFAPDEDIPGGGHIESTRSTGALAAGVVVTALAFVPTAYVGARSPRRSDQILFAPVVGPWLDLANRPTCTPPNVPIKVPVDPCIEETASRAALITSGALQGLGALLTVVGLPSRSRIVDGGDRGVSFLPTLNGAAAIGTF